MNKIIVALCFLPAFWLHPAAAGSDWHDFPPQEKGPFAEGLDWQDFLPPMEPQGPFCSTAEKEILDAALLYAENFEQYVASDIGYAYFRKALTRQENAIFEHYSFEEDDICTVFSQLRCAACFAMVLNDNVDEGVFSAALKECHAVEVYQVFVAADSYNKGLGTSRKFQKLKSQALQLQDPPEELTTPGGLFARHSWLAKKIHVHQSDIFTQEFPWLPHWEASRTMLSDFLKKRLSEQDPNIAGIFMQFLCCWPYVLHHLAKSDFQQYAHAILPLLCDPSTFCSFSTTIKDSCPFDPHKEDIVHICDQIFPIVPMNLGYPPQPHALQGYCTSLVNTLWTLFGSLNAHVTQEQWGLCVKILRTQHPWVSDAFTQNYDWLEAVFTHRACSQTCSPSTTCFAYYAKHHAPYIFTRHEAVINDLYKILKKHCDTDEKNSTCEEVQKEWRDCEKIQKKLRDHDKIDQYNVIKRNLDLQKFLIFRGCILWRLAKKGVLTPEFLCLYNTCTFAEKKALELNAHHFYMRDNPCKTHLQEITIPDLTENLSRLSLSTCLDVGFSMQ